MASILVICGPVGGRMRVRSLWPRVERCFRESGVNFHSVATRAPLEATELARTAVGKYEVNVAVGGDGTMSKIVNGLLQVSGKRETMNSLQPGLDSDVTGGEKGIGKPVSIDGTKFDRIADCLLADKAVSDVSEECRNRPRCLTRFG